MKKTLLKKTSIVAYTIKSGLAMSIPIIFVGSIAVLLGGFPVQAYQDFLQSFLGGALASIIIAAKSVTVNILAAYITIALSISYMNRTTPDRSTIYRILCVFSCLASFLILIGIFLEEPDFTMLSGQGVFSALIAGILGSMLFRYFEQKLNSRKILFFDGVTSQFSEVLHMLLPFVCVVFCFAIANYLITIIFDVDSLQHLFMKAMGLIFASMQRSFGSTLLYMFLISIMWFLGIHGNNVLNQVSEDMFTQIIPGETISKSFIDTFVNIGGTGCLLGLLIALIIFGKRSTTKKLSAMAFAPGLFNIGEMLVFGLPIIYNPMMLVPFIFAPILCFSSAYFFTELGFLPQVTNSVVWSTPALLSGYLATDSYRGIIVQIINILIATACYAPFVILYEKKALNEFSSAFDEIVDAFKQSEAKGEDIILTECSGKVGRYAKQLATDLSVVLSSLRSKDNLGKVNSPLKIDYKKQYENEKCIGAKANLYWEHRECGRIDEALVIKLAKESGALYELETYIINRVVSESNKYCAKNDNEFAISIVVRKETLTDESFISFLQETADRYGLKMGHICFEIDYDEEQFTSNEGIELINDIKSLGYNVKFIKR